MKMNKNLNEAFIESCKKAGLNVKNREGKSVAKGLVVCDGKGRKYSVNDQAEIVRTDLITVGRLKGHNRRMIQINNRGNRYQRTKHNTKQYGYTMTKYSKKQEG